MLKLTPHGRGHVCGLRPDHPSPALSYLHKIFAINLLCLFQSQFQKKTALFRVAFLSLYVFTECRSITFFAAYYESVAFTRFRCAVDPKPLYDACIS